MLTTFQKVFVGLNTLLKGYRMSKLSLKMWEMKFWADFCIVQFQTRSMDLWIHKSQEVYLSCSSSGRPRKINLWTPMESSRFLIINSAKVQRNKVDLHESSDCRRPMRAILGRIKWLRLSCLTETACATGYGYCPGAGGSPRASSQRWSWSARLPQKLRLYRSL